MTSIRHLSAHANIQVPASQHTGPKFYTSDRRFSAHYACTTPMRPNRPTYSATSAHNQRSQATLGSPRTFFFGITNTLNTSFSISRRFYLPRIDLLIATSTFTARGPCLTHAGQMDPYLVPTQSAAQCSPLTFDPRLVGC